LYFREKFVKINLIKNFKTNKFLMYILPIFKKILNLNWKKVIEHIEISDNKQPKKMNIEITKLLTKLYLK